MNLLHTSLLSATLVLAGCGSYAGGGGGGGPKNVGGPEGGNCNLEFHNQGCAPGTSPAQKVQCQDKAGTATWVDAGTCTANQYCLEEKDPADTQGIKKIATCKDIPASGGGVDAVTGDGNTTNNDATSDAGGGKTPAEEYACIEQKCPTQVSACKANPKCNALILCVNACANEACRDKCGAGVGEDRAVFGLLIAMTNCGSEQKCIEPEVTSPVCGDGKCESPETATSCAKDCQTTGPKCGNAVCEEGETPSTCPQDCKTTGPKCGNETCEEGETPSTCPQDCQATAKCGNEKCESGESYTSCPTDCPCKSNAECGSGKMCSDGNCVPDGGSGTCGDFKCTSGETKTSCAIDCDPEVTKALSCVEQKCSSDWGKCKSSKSCVDALVCMTKCSDENCIIACATKSPSDIATLQAVGECADKNCGGTSTGPVCGDGKCESPESTSTCPKDCQPAGGTCSSHADCQVKKGEACNETSKKCESNNLSGSCAGNCGSGSKQGNCYCDTQCLTYGDCCKDWCAAP